MLAVAPSTLTMRSRKNNAWNWPVYQTTAWPIVRPTSARITIFRFFHWPNDSASGAFDSLPSLFMRWNAGDSDSDSRIHTDTPSSTIDSRYGMRQPH